MSKNTYKFKIHSIEDLNFQLINTGKGIKIDPANLHFNISFRTSIINAEKLIEIFLIIKVRQIIDKKEVTFYEYSNKNIFKVGSLDAFLNSKGNERVFIPFISIAISTARGILIEKTAGYAIGNYILPVFDVNTLVPSEEESNKKK